MNIKIILDKNKVNSFYEILFLQGARFIIHKSAQFSLTTLLLLLFNKITT